MGSSRRTQLWLLAFLAISSVPDVSPLKVMIAPNLLRVATVENIFVQCQDCTESIKVDIKVWNHPTRAIILESTSVTLNSTNDFQTFGQITIPARHFSKDSNMKQHVYLQAQFPFHLLEKVVLVSFQSGYIFIQTDKTLYTPDSKVHYRIFVMTPRMGPMERNNGTKTDASVVTEIVTPEGIILPLGTVIPTSGIVSGHHKLSDIVSPGLWKVVAKFYSNPQQSYSAEFEVKEYVLPSFEVKLTLEKEGTFFHVDSERLPIKIEARYLFGEEVDGMAFVVFGIMQGDQKNSLPSSLQRVSVMNGEGKVELMREHITQTFPNILDLVGSSIYVSVSVLTESGSEMVEAELRGIQIVISPYTIHFKRTPRYFKPGIPFNVAVEVVNPEGTPAIGVPVVVAAVNQDNVMGLTGQNGMARLSINTDKMSEPMEISAKTEVPDITQASASMTALPYTTRSNSYIHIGLDAAEVTLGKNLKIDFILSQHQIAQYHTTYLILSRGQLLKFGRHQTRALTSTSLIVTKELLPSFRIIAYYATKENEVVSDSVWVDVEDSCMGKLMLTPKRDDRSYRPGKLFNLRVTGDPKATVGLVAVDKGVYVLNNKHRLTQKKIWDLVEEHDTGCTPGGGRDSMGVFYDAGLLFQSTVGSGTSYRLELKCPTPSRRKRANTIFDIRTSLVSQYTEKKQRECCLDGMKETLLSYTCERRSEYITDDTACVEAFLHCCKELELQRDEKRHDSLLLARSEEDDDYMDSNEIVSRTKFPESWLWSEIKLPPCSNTNPNCDTTTFDYSFPLQDSITTWQFTGISLSKTHGICVANPLEVIVRKTFFIDLRLPYSAVRGEQIEIKAVLHNYNEESITVRLDLTESPHVCSSASRRKRYRQEVDVGSKTTLAVPFVIIPMKEGSLPIEVKAAVKESMESDGVKKNLLVVPEGILTKTLKSVTLDPAKKGVGGKQEEFLNSEIPQTDLVPNTPAVTDISVTGREQISALVENALNGKSMGTLIKQPSGCGEQNMISMTLPVIATTYLDKTNQWEAVGFQVRENALQHITTGYKNELNYRKKDGSYAVFRDHHSSTWLTAYVVKVFAMANILVEIKPNDICEAITFLINKTQQSDGSFREFGKIIHGEMIGDVKGADSDASLTAFCLIAMQESRTICERNVTVNLTSSIDNAVAYLEGRLYNLSNPYAAVMTSYALANENKLDKQILNKFISSDLTHWPVRDRKLFTLEATAYGLLALIKAKDFERARPVVRWFNQQQIDGGGYGSTQATIMVYQAIAEYWISAREEEYDVNVDIEIAGRTSIEKINFNRANHYTTRTSKVNKINQNVKLTATGTGEATVKMVSLYYARAKPKESSCQKFDLSVQLTPERVTEDEKIYKLKIQVLYKEKNRNATMSILDIGLLTGFTYKNEDLNSLSQGHARVISKYETDKILSERGSLIIYLDKVSNTQPEEITFRIHQEFKGGLLQPAAVSVYEYYDHQNNNATTCVKYYHPQREDGELQRLCVGDQCTCAEENCSMQKKEKISNEDREDKACETTMDNRIDFVYKVRLENFTNEMSTDIYTMRILEVIKEGSDECQREAGGVNKEKTCDIGPLGNLRPFISYRHCRAALNLNKGKTYLIMGTAKDIHKDSEGQSYQYLLGERTWIEYWPTETECQSEAEYRSTCIGMESLVTLLTLFGCPL